jgi:hypothetical protein
MAGRTKGLPFLHLVANASPRAAHCIGYISAAVSCRHIIKSSIAGINCHCNVLRCICAISTHKISCGSGICLVINVVGLLGCTEVLQVTISRRIVSPPPVGGKLRDGDSRQDPDDSDNYHQLYKGEAFLIFHLV